ncbi:E3 ubiquitin-protein ligase TRIM35-like [Protopterus annectens]|uniref:E3 ubiquitin-protein ligase TRIM35-like n=1 Tax=Protopterus annectens TaxID=7888 RepID=UPI001CFB96EA|nr:E3 ubiquitin-protein ligase TRIM35-like [Protopterus annectens]
MASKVFICNIEDDLSCFLCSQIFKQAVSIHCGHNFCRECIIEEWEIKSIRTCPVCGEPSALDDVRNNHTLNAIVEKLVKEQNQSSEERQDDDEMCSQHQEKLKVYCVDDKSVICCVCQLSSSHENHFLRPIKEAADEYKETVRKNAEIFRQRLLNFEKSQKAYDDIMINNKNQALIMEEQIKKEFKELHNFLKNEENCSLLFLKIDKEHKRQAMERKQKYITAQIETLAVSIANAEEALKQDDITFLKHYGDATERIADTIPDPISSSDLKLLDVEAYLGLLKQTVCQKMSNHFQAGHLKDTSPLKAGLKTCLPNPQPAAAPQTTFNLTVPNEFKFSLGK